MFKSYLEGGDAEAHGGGAEAHWRLAWRTLDLEGRVAAAAVAHVQEGVQDRPRAALGNLILDRLPTLSSG